MPINPAYQFMNVQADLSDKNQFMDFLRRDAQAKGFDSNYTAGLANDQQMMNTMAAQQPQPQPRTAPRPQPRTAPRPSFPIPEAPQDFSAPYQGNEFGGFDMPIPQEPSGLVERSQMTEEDLPPEAPQGMRIAPPEQGITIEPPTDFGDMRDDRLDQTTLAQRGREMGIDPRQLMVALAQFSAGMGNIKGKDTASTAKDFYKMQLGIEQQQRDNDFKMEEMSKRYAPKPQREDPLTGLKQQMLQSQVEGQQNKVAIDAELNNPMSERSATARKLFRTYLYQSSSTKLPQSEVDKLVPENATAATIYKMMPLGTAGVSQFNAADAMTQRLQSEAAEKEKNRQAQLALEQERQRGRMQTMAAKPLQQQKIAGAPITKAPTADQAARAEQVKQMQTENKRLDSILQRFDPTSRRYMGRMSMPLGFKGSDWQDYETAAKQFLEPVLRKRTGAAVTEDELENQMQQTFPMPGDSPAVVQAKSVKRQQIIAEMNAWAGGASVDLQQQTQQPATIGPRGNKEWKP